MLEQFRIFHAALRLGQFTSKQLADASGVAEGTVQKTLRRRKELFNTTKGPPTKKRGGQSLLHTVRKDGLTAALQQAADAVELPDLPTKKTGEPLGLILAEETLCDVFPRARQHERPALLVAALMNLDLAGSSYEEAVAEFRRLAEALSVLSKAQLWLLSAKVAEADKATRDASLGAIESLLSMDERNLREKDSAHRERTATVLASLPSNLALCSLKYADATMPLWPAVIASQWVLLTHPRWQAVVGDVVADIATVEHVRKQESEAEGINAGTMTEAMGVEDAVERTLPHAAIAAEVFTLNPTPSQTLPWPPLVTRDSDGRRGDSKVWKLMKDAEARRLFQLEQLEVNWDEEAAALWTFIWPRRRPIFNLDLLDDFHAWQRGISAMFADRPQDLQYLLLGSRTSGVFNLGEDLDYLLAKMQARDRQGLVDYGESCVRILHRNLHTLDLPVISIGLAQGDAFGGGFETLLSFNVIIAERGTKFGFPETMFGLFPGMGAHSLVTRYASAAFAKEMMLTGRIYSAEEMKEVGLVHMVVEPGRGIEAARDFMGKNKRRHVGARAVFKADHAVNPVTLEELDGIVQIWADACLQLPEREQKVMRRLVAAQEKLQSPRRVGLSNSDEFGTERNLRRSQSPNDNVRELKILRRTYAS